MKKFAKYESFDPGNKEHLDALSRHEFYCPPGKILVVIDESNQPERSKREDSCPPLSSSMTHSQWKQFMEDMRCGTLNTTVMP